MNVLRERHATIAVAPVSESPDSLGQVHLDTLRRVATPEGIELTLRLAGPVPRALAWMIDLLLRLGALFVVAFALAVFGRIGEAVLLLVWFALEWLFPAWCEVRFAGATPGKKAFGLAVVHDDGRPVGWSAALTRNLLRAVDFLPVFYGFGLAAMLANRDSKRLGDLAAGTVVVYRDRPERRLSMPEATPIPPPVALSVDEQRVIIEYAERSSSLTEERAIELAAIAPSITRGASGKDAMAMLVAVANHLAGREASVR